jgi:hypothetical protein
LQIRHNQDDFKDTRMTIAAEKLTFDEYLAISAAQVLAAKQ